MAERVAPSADAVGFSDLLPRPVTSLVGRAADVGRIRARLLEDDCRLLTLLGPGGVGKTRLAIAVVEQIGTADGIPFIDLAHVRDGSAVLPAIAAHLAITDSDRAPLDTVAERLRDGYTVLVLDNLEQIVGVAAPVANLLDACPGLTILATSRTPVGLHGEQRWPVAPLPVPTSSDLTDIECSPAVDLFVRRARLARPDLVLTKEIAADVAAICAHLDGLPLALELAAARMAVLSPKALLARLSHRLRLLTSDTHMIPDRHRTLYAAVAWTYDLLDPADQRMFRMVSVYPGPFTLDAAEFSFGPDALEQLTRLVDFNLIVPVDDLPDSPRFRMLETLRAFGLEQLDAHDERESAQSLAANWMRHRAAHWRSEDRARESQLVHVPFQRVKTELAAIDLALDYFASTENLDAVLEVAVASADAWNTWGRFDQSVRWLTLGLSTTTAPAELRGRALIALGTALHLLGRHGEEAVILSQAVDIFADGEEPMFLGSALYRRGLLAYSQGHYADARTDFEQSIALSAENDLAVLAAENVLAFVLLDLKDWDAAAAIFRRHAEIGATTGDLWTEAIATHNLACLAMEQGRDHEAYDRFAAALPLYEAVADRDGLSQTLSLLGLVAVRIDRVDEGFTVLRRGRDIASADGLRWAESVAQHAMGDAHLTRGNIGEAESHFRSALALRHELGVRLGMAETLLALGRSTVASGDEQAGAHLIGAADGIRERMGLPVESSGGGDTDLTAFRHDRQYAAAYAAGRHLGDDEAVGLGLQPPRRSASQTTPTVPTDGHQRSPHDLTGRELDVLRLVAQGKTNAEIGDLLFISPFTAKTHIANLLGKLMVENRAAAAAWAVQQGLV